MTISLASALYYVALALPVPSTEPGEVKEERLGIIGEAIAWEVAVQPWPGRFSNVDLAALVLTVWHEETRLDARVHAGEEHPTWTSDHGRSRCLGQIQVSALVPLTEWVELAGTDLRSTRRCAAATIRVLRAHAVCAEEAKDPREAVARILARYGSGISCEPTAATRKRAERWAAVRIALARAVRDGPSGVALSLRQLSSR